ncbi:MAG: hypothetical protein PHP85_12075 [Gallionella sp.]|nr:hypothetical protein [Gallionella sp.]
MIEYIFFDTGLRDKFVEYAGRLDVPCILSDDSMGFLVAIAEEHPEPLLDDLENRYDELQDEQASMCEEAGEFNRLSGFLFNLPDGQSRLLPLNTDMANRLISNFSLEEIQGLFEAVAECTLNSNAGHLCKILEEQK